MLLGQAPSFQISHPAALPIGALGAIAVFGVIAGIAGVGFNKCLLGFIALRDRLNIPKWSLGLMVGVLSGLLLAKFPQVSGGGHGLVASLLSGAYAPNDLLIVALVVFAGKLLFTVLSYGTGVPGGIFAPILVMGAFLGYAFGLVASRIYPDVGFNAVGFATIGMTGVLTASVRSPLTAVVLIVEMTAEYQLLYALLVGAFMSYATAEMLGDEPIYEALLERDLDKAGQIASPDAHPAIVDFLVEPDSDMDGRRIRDLDMPEGALITGVSRDDSHMVPRGTTRLRAGDMITAVVDGDDLTVSVKIHEMAKAPS
jgi:CIC family chloride channel protein